MYIQKANYLNWCFYGKKWISTVYRLQETEITMKYQVDGKFYISSRKHLVVIEEAEKITGILCTVSYFWLYIMYVHYKKSIVELGGHLQQILQQNFTK